MTRRKKVRLMVVDEHHAYHELLEQAIEMWHPSFDFECIFVDSGDDALQRMPDFAPTVIMVDAYIPDMNCLEFLKKCRDGVAPLVVTSANMSPETEESVLSHGARACLAKTEDPDEIEFMLDQIAHLSVEYQSTH